MTQTPPDESGRPGTSGAAAATPARRRRRRVWPRVIIGVAALLVLVIGGVTVYAYTVDRAVSRNITRGIDLPSDTPTPVPAGSPTPETKVTGALDYVLLGSDSRDPANAGAGRSDSIMVVHLNKARNRAYVISFPRDMYVTIPGHGKGKINSAYSAGGPALVVRTLQNLIGVQMDHVVLVDFEGFVDLTNDLGGITVTNKFAFNKAGYDFPKGKITIKGKQALWFVRERDQLPNGDLDRAANQRMVIKAIVSKGLSPAVISDPAKFTSFIGNMAKHLTVDNSLTDAEIRTTALSLRLSGDDIETLQAPLLGFGTVGTQSIDVVDYTKLAQLSSALKKDKMADYLKNNP